MCGWVFDTGPNWISKRFGVFCMPRRFNRIVLNSPVLAAAEIGVVASADEEPCLLKVYIVIKIGAHSC